MFRINTCLVLLSLMVRSFGFVVERSALAPATWDSAPSLDIYQHIFTNPGLNSKNSSIGLHTDLQIEDTSKLREKKLEKQEREKRSGLMPEGIGFDTKSVSNATSIMKNNSTNSTTTNFTVVVAPRNVILLLIDERDQNQNNSSEDYAEKLPSVTKGFLQNCHDKITGFLLENATVTGNEEKDCDCQRFLRTNIADLLFWARYTKNMTTGTVSSNNLLIPSSHRYKNFRSTLGSNRSNKSNAKLEIQKNKRDFNDWQLIDFNDQDKSKSLLLTSQPKADKTMNRDGLWDIFEVFSKIRMAFFSSLLESIGRNRNTFEDEFDTMKSFPVTQLIKNAIKELKSTSHDKGYMLIAVVPGNERAITVDVLQREISPKDTLFIIAHTCSKNDLLSPFVAQGPNNRMLSEAKTIWDLPAAIKKAITNNCHDIECESWQRRNIPII